MEEKWKELALTYLNQGMKKVEICNRINAELGCHLPYNKVKHWLWRQEKLRNRPEKEIKNTDKRVIVQNVEPDLVDGKWEGTQIIKFGLIGDTHIGSRYSQLTHLNEFYDICAKQCIDTVYHAGDISEGIKMRPGHEYELADISADDMTKSIIKAYPKRDGIKTYFITGNHDASLYKHVGYDIGQTIADKREDLIYIGRDCARINLTPKCTLELRHPWDGTSYALSYKPQKMIESFDGGTKPNIVAIGHYHKAGYFFYRNVHCILTGCFQSQTPFTIGKGIAVHMGGWIISVRVDKNGTIQGFNSEFVPFYDSIQNDYKNFR